MLANALLEAPALLRVEVARPRAENEVRGSAFLPLGRSQAPQDVNYRVEDGWAVAFGDDLQLAGDFMGLGHDQVMFINRGGTGGKLMVLDYALNVTPTQPGTAVYQEPWSTPGLLTSRHARIRAARPSTCGVIGSGDGEESEDRAVVAL